MQRKFNGNSSFNDPESNMSPSAFIHHFGDELHGRVRMFLSSRLLGVGISFQVQRGEEQGRQSCYQSAAPGSKMDRMQTSVQHSQTLTKTNFPQRHWTIVVSFSVKGHAAPLMLCLSHSIHLSDSPFLSAFFCLHLHFCVVSLTWCLVFTFFFTYLLCFISLWGLYFVCFFAGKLFEATEKYRFASKAGFHSISVPIHGDSVT